MKILKGTFSLRMFVGLFGLGTLASAASLQGAVLNQANIAIAHADLAMGAPDLNASHMHLHHVINCLVGPKSSAFDFQSEDPCLAIGKGAIVDANGDAALVTQLNRALALSEAGLKTTSLTASQDYAKKVAQGLGALTNSGATATNATPQAPLMGTAKSPDAGVTPSAMNQVNIAIAQAGLALGARQPTAAHVHLQHVISCLAGRKGSALDRHALDPCAGTETGALFDVKSNAKVEAALQEALDHANRGLTATTLPAVEAEAREVMSCLLAVSRM